MQDEESDQEGREEEDREEEEEKVICAGFPKGAQAPFAFVQHLRLSFHRLPQLATLARLLEERCRVTVTEVPDGALPFLACWAADRFRHAVVLVCPEQSADPHTEAVAAISPELPIVRFDPSKPGLAARLEEVARAPAVVVASLDALTAPAPVETGAPAPMKVLPGQSRAISELVAWLDANGYERTDLVTETGEFATRGGIVDVFAAAADAPARIEFGDDLVVSLRAFDPLSQRSSASLATLSVPTLCRAVQSDQPAAALLPRTALVITPDPRFAGDLSVLLTDEPGADLDLGLRPAGAYLGNVAALRAEIDRSAQEYYVVSASPHHRERLAILLGDRPRFVEGVLASGFSSDALCLTVLTEREIYGTPSARPVRHRFKGLPVDNLVALRPGDLVVHIDYGIGRFEGTRRIAQESVEKDYIVLHYAGSDRVYVPVENLGLIDRFVGSDVEGPALDRLGGRSWLTAKARAARASADYAQELLDASARRSLARGAAFPPDSREQVELEAAFPYDETPDQLKALADVKRDMQQPRPMDRLVCGDVGFGKTEVALRAAFKAAANLKQVAVLVPTTILCYQHFSTFRRRLEPFPLRVEMLSRFVTPSRQQEVVAALADGRVDIVVGTHLLLGQRIRFRDLGLLIVDEEQKFGVRQKERIRALRAGVDVLTLTATPIPRTLYMALAGLRDITPIHTPPPGRREILTEVSDWNDGLIRDYVLREVNHGGQVFFVHNEIQTIHTVRRRLERLLPGVRMAVGHGQMPGRRLADTYLGFAAGEFQLLLSTAIVESGLDMPNVNTIIVNRADRFGLSDLHQLRGRVGRSATQAHALFLVPQRREMTLDARKRLSALLAYSHLGAGYKLALRDMEIRGVGNLLGTEQHGHVARIGFALYTQMLKEAVGRLKGEPVAAEPELSLELPAYLPEDYVADSYERVALYKRLLAVETEAELDGLRSELVDRFGRYPPVVENLFRIALVRALSRRLGLLKVSLKKGAATVVGPVRTSTVTGGIEALLELLGREAGQA